MKWKMCFPLLLCILGMFVVEARTKGTKIQNMIPASADIGESADLYCSAGGDQQYIQWSRSNQTHEEEIDGKSGSRFKITEMTFQGVSPVGRDRYYHDTFCPILKPEPKTNGSTDYPCTTSVLTVSNVTAEDYNMTYTCLWNNRWDYSSKERSGKIINPESEGTHDFVSSTYKNAILQCAGNHNTSWFFSSDNQSLTIINEPEKLQTYWASEHLYEQMSSHKGGLYESLLIVDDNKILQDIFFYCGTSVESAVFVNSVSNRNNWQPRYEDMWYTLKDYYIWKVCFVLPPLILVAAIIALTRVGIQKTCYNHCCIKLAALIAQRRQPQGVLYTQFVHMQPLSTVQSEEVTSQSGQSSAVLDLIDEVTNS